MDILVINNINDELAVIEAALLKVDALIPKVSPDMKSTMATKRVIFDMLNDLSILRQDIADYREGKAIKVPNPQDIVNKIIDAMKNPPQSPPPNFPPSV